MDGDKRDGREEEEQEGEIGGDQIIMIGGTCDQNLCTFNKGYFCKYTEYARVPFTMYRILLS